MRKLDDIKIEFNKDMYDIETGEILYFGGTVNNFKDVLENIDRLGYEAFEDGEDGKYRDSEGNFTYEKLAIKIRCSSKKIGG